MCKCTTRESAAFATQRSRVRIPLVPPNIPACSERTGGNILCSANQFILNTVTELLNVSSTIFSDFLLNISTLSKLAVLPWHSNFLFECQRLFDSICMPMINTNGHRNDRRKTLPDKTVTFAFSEPIKGFLFLNKCEYD